MEPLKPKDVERARETGASDEDLAEYNRLIAERFSTNPYIATSPTQVKVANFREQRIGDLYQKLFSAVTTG